MAKRPDMARLEMKFRQAVQAFEAGNLASAHSLCTELTAADPNCVPAYQLLGAIAFRKGDPSSAVKWFKHLVRLAPQSPEGQVNLGLALAALGHHDEALPCFQKAVRAAPTIADLHNHLGNGLKACGRVLDAIGSYQNALRIMPRFSDFHANLGMALFELGRTEEAAAAFQKAREYGPGNPRAEIGLGLVSQAAGRLDEAERCFQTALRREPGNPTAHFNLGMIYQRQGKLPEAELSYAKALHHKSDYPEALTNLGALKAAQGLTAEAVELHLVALRFRPDYLPALINLGSAQHFRGRHDEAMEALTRAVKVNPESAEAQTNLGMVLKDLGQLSEAEDCHRAALRVRPDFPEALINLGHVLTDQIRPDEAIDCFERALKAKPDLWSAHTGLALALLKLARSAEAMACFEEALRRAPTERVVLNNLMTTALYREDLSQQDLKTLALRLGGAIRQDEVLKLPATARSAGSKLRLGYLSSDLYSHSVGYNMLPVIRSHDRERFSLHFYANILTPDEMTAEFRALADGWHDIIGQRDAVVADRIRADEIDILVSLAGRFDQNRPSVCAYRAAPVQISLHDPATSGIAEMDYIIGDRWLLPRSSEEFFTERRLRLPQFYVADFPPSVPAIPKMRPEAPITFGSFNNPIKVNDRVLQVWGTILAALPESRLVVKHFNNFEPPSLQARYRHTLEKAGARAEQLVILTGLEKRGELLKRYNEIDIALDPFPFSGSTTSFQSLTMGVPVVTWPWDRMVSRWTEAMLRPLGLSQLIAASAEEYVDIAILLAAESDEWWARRQDIQDRVAGSALCDGSRWTRHLERLYLAAWRKTEALTGRTE